MTPFSFGLNRPSNNIDSLPIEEQKTRRYREDTAHRKYLVYWVMCLSSLWLIIVGYILCSVGFGYMVFSDTVLLMLLGTTTANVLGLPLIVLHGLFSNKSILENNNKT